MVALRMALAAIVPVILAVAFHLLEKKTKFGQLEKKYRQIIIGVVFGIVACLATQFGIPYEKYMLNVRSAAPLTAGLVFGGWAGIIAGVIGAIYRALSILWGVPKYTVVACSVATLLAGIISTVAYKYMHDGKRVPLFYGVFIAIATEVFHMLLVFITHMNDIYYAFGVVKATAIPMILANALSIFATLTILQLMSKERFFPKKSERHITQTFSIFLLASVIICFLITSLFTYFLEDNVSEKEAETTLTMNLSDVENDIKDMTDNDILSKAQTITTKYTKPILGFSSDESIRIGQSQLLANLCRTYGVSEINVVNLNGVIIYSSNQSNWDDSIENGKISSDFSCLLSGTETYVQSYQSTAKDQSVYMKYAGVATSDGFIMVGYNFTDYKASVASTLSGIATNRHIGQYGFMFIMAPTDGSVVSAPANTYSISEVPIFADTINNHPDNTVDVYSPKDGEDYYYIKDNVEGYLVVACIPVSEITFSRDMSLYIGLFMQFLVFFILFILVFFLNKHAIVDNIHKVNESLSLITEGNLDIKVNISDSAEFVSLSNDINATVDRLKGYIEEEKRHSEEEKKRIEDEKKRIEDEKKRIDMELQFAKTIQQSVIPSKFPNRADFDIYALMDTAKEVGGDFYDFYPIGNNHFVFLIADVSGKGISAAMFMMNAKSIIKGLFESGLDISEVVTKTNTKLCNNNEALLFVTAWIGILDVQTGVINYVNAGHNPPLIRRKNGAFEYMKGSHGFVIAGMDGVKYKKNAFTLQSGDEIFIYTDGITEAINSETEQFGEDRLLGALNQCKNSSSLEICNHVQDTLKNFVAGAEQFDDITMLSLKYIGNAGSSNTIKNELTVLADTNNIPKVTKFVENELLKINCPPKIKVQINVAIDELFSNIARYAYGTQNGNVTVQTEISDNTIVITFIDSGIEFNPLEHEAPDITLSAEQRDIGGLGILMVKKTMDDVHYEYKDNKNIITIIKKI